MNIRRLALLGSVVFLCFLLLTVQMRTQSSLASDAVAYVTTPVQTFVAKVHRIAFVPWETYLEWKNVRADNVRLRGEIEQLRVASLQATDTAVENRRLRTLLDLQQRLPLVTMSGEVIGREWGGWVRSLTVNRGRGDRVNRLTAVITPEGLIGRVVDVRPGASIVQLLSDPASTIGAHIVRTRTPGIVEGESRGTIRFKYMARDGPAIQVGDVVVTSGLGGLFPRGIPIGTVRAIENRGSALFHYAALTPVVDFSIVEEVLLLTDPNTTRDVTAHFATGG